MEPKLSERQNTTSCMKTLQPKRQSLSHIDMLQHMNAKSSEESFSHHQQPHLFLQVICPHKQITLQYQPLALPGQNPLHPPTLVANRDALSLRDDSFITANLIDYMLEMALRERPESTHHCDCKSLFNPILGHNEQIKSESY